MKNSNPNSEPLEATAAATLSPFSGRCIIVNGPVIVGAGPSGLAVAASLRLQGVPFVILERATCVASLWQSRTYDRLSLHLPKSFCRLPHLDFPAGLPEYPSRAQFVDYLESYTDHFDIRPRFGEVVIRAEQDETCGLWRVKTVAAAGVDGPAVAATEYLCRWLVVATGENAEKVMPEIEGLANFGGNVMHACDYKSGRSFSERRVLVVGCGNSGMEISLDLAHHGALPAMVVRSSIHVMPREIFGLSTYSLACTLCKWLPIRAVDTFLLAASRLILGKTEDYGLKRPSIGPLELKNSLGKTPVLDLGTLSLIKSGDIRVVPEIKRFLQNGVELVNGEILEIDSVIMATGYSSNVPSWLKESDFFLKNGFPKMPFPNGWKGREGLYAVGFGRKGLAGAAADAVKVAKDIASNWNQETMRNNVSSKAHALSYN